MLRSLRAVRSVATALPMKPVHVPSFFFAAKPEEEVVVDTDRIKADSLIPDKPSDLKEAIRVVKSFMTTTHDQTLSLALDLNVDPRKPNQMVRGMVSVPHSSGKKVVICVFASGEKAEEARMAGADIIGDDLTLRHILDGKIEFTRCLATPDQMRVLARVARVLGPRGMMPNPKLGTVTNDMKGAIEAARKGQIQYKCDRQGTLNVPVGRASWEDKKIIENVDAFVTALIEAKPTGAKGAFFNKVYLSSTKGISKVIDLKTAPFRIL